jgi:small-conductance mechanosensitive channel
VSRHITNAKLTEMLAEELAVSDCLRRDLLAIGEKLTAAKLQNANLRKQLKQAHAALRRVRKNQTQQKLRGVG